MAGVIFFVTKEKVGVIEMIDLLISSLKVGLGFIGLMTPAVIYVMWRQWQDFGEPRIKMQYVLPK